jgi:hypothetical protein
MTDGDLARWLDEIASAIAMRAETARAGNQRAEDDAALLTEMQSAIEAVFGSSHAIRRRWEDARRRSSAGPMSDRPVPDSWFFEEFQGLFASAHLQAKQGHIRTLADGIRAETVGECLEVADVLLAANHAVAAMVVAGGALEVHLRHLCLRNSLNWPGSGSIEKYKAALDQARNEGVETISPSDSKQVNAWGGRRNDAAHDPVKFTGSVSEVRLIVEGIRQFVARTP